MLSTVHIWFQISLTYEFLLQMSMNVLVTIHVMLMRTVATQMVAISACVKMAIPYPGMELNVKVCIMCAV